MKTLQKLQNLFAGIDAKSLDTRTFEISKKDLEAICCFFSIGKIKSYKKEKDIVVSHSNFFIFVKTTKGEYALKFFPPDKTRSLSIEFTINRFLVNHNFPTPLMHCGHNRQAYTSNNGLLASCFSFIPGIPAWQNINAPATIHQINNIIFSLKKTLAEAPSEIPHQKQENFITTARKLIQTSKKIATYDERNFINQSLQNVCQAYQQDRNLFTRRWLHNNTTLSNFILYQNTPYVLDLSHIREDYALADLTSLIISCIYLNVSKSTITHIIKNYYLIHKIGPKYLRVFNVLLKISLIKEYLKTIRRKKFLYTSESSPKSLKTYQFYLQERKRSIIAILKNKHFCIN